jgi:glycosyltransferase involved in cell wall biosynthesis
VTSRSILIVVPSLSGGGAEKIAVNLANHWHCSGRSVKLLVFKLVGPYKKQLHDDLMVINLKAARTRFSIFYLLAYILRHQHEAILSVLRDSNIICGLAFFFDRKTTLIFREANTLDAIRRMPPLKNILYTFLMKLSYRRANIVIANSLETKNDLLRSKIVNPEKVISIGNPVISSTSGLLSSEVVSHRWLDDEECKVVLSVGRLHYQKNHALLIRAFAEAVKLDHRLRLIVIGEGEEKNNLVSLSRSLDVYDKIDFISFQQSIYPYYANCDVFVLTSRWEGFGNVLVEALYCGARIICTKCPGGPVEILNNGEFGRIIPNYNIGALAGAILEEIGQPQSPSRRASLRNQANNFSVEKIASEYLQLLDTGHIAR